MKGKGGILLKKQSNLSRLLMNCGKLPISDLCVLDPLRNQRIDCTRAILFIWQVMREVLEVAPNFSRAQNLTHNG